MNLTNNQINDMAIVLVSTITSFYENAENEAAFQKWLKSRGTKDE